MPAPPAFSKTELLTLAGFLAGYSGLTREPYELDLRQFASEAVIALPISGRSKLSS